MTSTTPVRCSTNCVWSHTLEARSIYWVHVSREEWNDVKYMWNNSYLDCGCRWKWLHSSVGRTFHRYRGGHGFEYRWSPDFFRLLLSSCLNWKINCDDHSSLSSTTAVQISIISYILHIRLVFFFAGNKYKDKNKVALTSSNVWLENVCQEQQILFRMSQRLSYVATRDQKVE